MKTELKIELFQDTKGEWRFRIKSRNGKTIAQSEGYKRRLSAEKTITKIINHTGNAEVITI